MQKITFYDYFLSLQFTKSFIFKMIYFSFLGSKIELIFIESKALLIWLNDGLNFLSFDYI